MIKIRDRSLEFAHDFAAGVFSYRDRIIIQSTFLIAALATGAMAVCFDRFVKGTRNMYGTLYTEHPYIMACVSPFTILAAAAVVKYLSPSAGGSGLPQVLHAASLSNEKNDTVVSSGLLSWKTAIVKTLSTGLGLLGGASIGGEGPTVQIAGVIFANIGQKTRKYFPSIDLRSYIVASGGAGIAAAFNAPLGGVAFALEEVALSSFGSLRHAVMLAVVVAGLTAQAIVGNETYFGHLGIDRSAINMIPWAIFIGVACGLLGGLFARTVASRTLYELKISWWVRALACGTIVSLIGFALNGSTAGSGYVITRAFMDGTYEAPPIYFSVAKMFATAFSTLSGLGGGILAPSLSIGAWTGVAIAKLAVLANPKIFALIGMAAYFASTFQIPLTAVIIVMEMTNEHEFIFPMMIASIVAYGIGKLMMPTSLYHVLIERSYHKKTLSD